MIEEERARRNVSANVMRLMKKEGMSQPRLAALTGHSVMAINHLVHGKNNASGLLLARIAEVFDMSVDRLLAEPPPPPIATGSDNLSESLQQTS